MTRTGWLALITASVCAPCAALGAGASQALAAAALSPQLQALEAKALALNVSSAHFSSEIRLTEGGASAARTVTAGEGSPTTISVEGVEQFHPALASFSGSAGGVKVQGRLLGSDLYVYEPSIAKTDGGRPWVQETGQSIEKAVGGELGAASTPGSGASDAYGELIQELNSASAITEAGPQTVDGQSTSLYTATIEPTANPRLTAAQRTEFERDFAPNASLEVFFAEDGLPVRTRLTLDQNGGPGTLTVRADILAVNVAVNVRRPAARRTITLAHLKRLLAHKSKK